MVEICGEHNQQEQSANQATDRTAVRHHHNYYPKILQVHGSGTDEPRALRVISLNDLNDSQLMKSISKHQAMLKLFSQRLVTGPGIKYSASNIRSSFRPPAVSNDRLLHDISQSSLSFVFSTIGKMGPHDKEMARQPTAFTMHSSVSYR